MARKSFAEKLIIAAVKDLARAAKRAEKERIRAAKHAEREYIRELKEQDRYEKQLERERVANQKVMKKAKLATQKKSFTNYQEGALQAFNQRCSKRNKIKVEIINSTFQ